MATAGWTSSTTLLSTSPPPRLLPPRLLVTTRTWTRTRETTLRLTSCSTTASSSPPALRRAPRTLRPASASPSTWATLPPRMTRSPIHADARQPSRRILRVAAGGRRGSSRRGGAARARLARRCYGRSGRRRLGVRPHVLMWQRSAIRTSQRSAPRTSLLRAL